MSKFVDNSLYVNKDKNKNDSNNHMNSENHNTPPNDGCLVHTIIFLTILYISHALRLI